VKRVGSRFVFLVLAMGSSGIALGQYASVPLKAPGKISGRVTFAGAVAPLAPETRDKDPEVCGSTHENQTLEVGSQGGLKNVVVYLKDIQAGKPLTPVIADLDQVGCTYVPHVQAVPVGSTLNLLNHDPLLHNIHAVQGGSAAFNYAMPQSVRKIPKRLVKPGFLTIKCDVHGWMNGVVAVLDNPYFAVTDADGSFALDLVPPGTYTIVAWHERLGEKTQSVTIRAGEKAKTEFVFSNQ
jgi:plastocyanin